jgi:hypothetical protein
MVTIGTVTVEEAVTIDHRLPERDALLNQKVLPDGEVGNGWRAPAGYPQLATFRRWFLTSCPM